MSRKLPFVALFVIGLHVCEVLIFGTSPTGSLIANVAATGGLYDWDGDGVQRIAARARSNSTVLATDRAGHDDVGRGQPRMDVLRKLAARFGPRRSPSFASCLIRKAYSWRLRCFSIRKKILRASTQKRCSIPFRSQSCFSPLFSACTTWNC